MRATWSSLPSLAAALVVVAAAACTEVEEQAPACAVYLQCFFYDGGTRYPHPDDGGIYDAGPYGEPGDEPRVEVYDYGSFHEQKTRDIVTQAMGEGGYCWRKDFDGGSSAKDCERACREALFDDCRRHAVYLASDGGTQPPVCLDPTRPADPQLEATASRESCTDLFELLDAGGTPDGGAADAGG